MQKFRFRLQQVLEYRGHLEDESKDRLAMEQGKLARLLAEGKRLADETARWSRNYLDTAREGLTPVEADRIHCYMKDLGRLQEENRRQAAKQSETVEQVRAELLERMRERKIMETLRDRQKARFEKEERRREEQAVEELVVSRLARPG